MSENKGIPKAILQQINENSGGCYFLFNINEKGEPYFNYHLDHEMMFPGMLKRLRNILDSLSIMDELEGEGVKNAFLEEMGICDISNMEGLDIDIDPDLDDEMGPSD